MKPIVNKECKQLVEYGPYCGTQGEQKTKFSCQNMPYCGNKNKYVKMS